jgi:hypothetical protein
MSKPPNRVVVWSTGGIGTIAVRAVAENPDLDLVGVWVHSPDKVGRDAGDLVELDPIGVTATDDAAALIGLRPDCVVYAASGPERDGAAVPDYVRLLEGDPLRGGRQAWPAVGNGPTAHAAATRISLNHAGHW